MLRPLSSVSQTLDSEQVQAVYTYKFGKFTTWPTLPRSDDAWFHICILGDNPFSRPILSQLESNSVQNLSIRVELFPKGLAANESLSRCQILFISESEKYRLNLILTTLKQQPILTISAIDEFAEQGGMIQLINQNHKIRFKINYRALIKAGLVVSSKLLQLADVINLKE